MLAGKLPDGTIGLLGIGRETLSVVRAIARRGVEPQGVIFSDTLPETIPSELSNFELVTPTSASVTDATLSLATEQLAACNLIVKSPGISKLHPLIQLLEKNNTPFVSATTLWLEEHHSIKTICITGTKGKSTTASLVHHILNQCGQSALLGGNIGTALFDLEPLPSELDWLVLELSSYQLAHTLPEPAIAVLTNLYPEHIDWHGGESEYYSDKLRVFGADSHIFNTEKISVVNRALYAQFQKQLPPISRFDFNHQTGLRVSSDLILDGQTTLGCAADFKLHGRHNLHNITAALSVARACNIDLCEALTAATTFKGLPHRLEQIGTYHDITFINDSIATIPQATIGATNAFCRDSTGKPLTVIVGGRDRGLEWRELAKHLHSTCSHVIATAESGTRILEHMSELESGPNTAHTVSAKSLEAATEVALDITESPGTILYSPGAPTAPPYRDYIERGEIFSRLVRNRINAG
jgi:UDP-N-acetylmuramoylalanine--D-glutamate ligase